MPIKPDRIKCLFLPGPGLNPVLLIVIFTTMIGLSCSNQRKDQPETVIPGYKTSLSFQDTFSTISDHWFLEGSGKVDVTEDNRVQLTINPGSQGVTLWLCESFKGSFQLEYELDFPSSQGRGAVIFCAQPRQGGDILSTTEQRNGNDILNGSSLNSYQIYYHNYNPDSEQDTGSKFIKNPGQSMLARTDVDPCRINRYYLIDIAKTGNRIQFFVDGQKIHDLRDRGGFSDPLKEGYIGFWFQGEPPFTVMIDNVRVFKLNPR